MGVLSQLANNKAAFAPSPTNRGRSAAIWQELFGSTHKEDTSKFPRVRANSHGRSISNSGPAQERLIRALSSYAPGGWSDDRWEQAARHYVSIAYTAIHRQNELLTQAEFQVFKKDDDHPDGKRPITKDDPAEGDRVVKPYDLVKLLEHPNEDDSFGDLLANFNLQLDLTGMALAWMVPNQVPSGNPDKDRYPEGTGTPFKIYPIPTAIAIPQPAINPDFPDGYYRIQPIYPYGPFSSYPTPSTAVGAPIPAQWMLRVKYPHPLLRYDGYSPLTAIRLQQDSLEGIEKSRWYKMKRSFQPNVVLQMEDSEGMQPLAPEEIDRIKAEVENAFFGPENAGNLLVASPGSKFEEFGTSPKEMDYNNSWTQLVDFVMAALGIAKSAAGMTDSSSYASLFASLKQVYWLTLDPKCARVANKMTRHLAPFFGDDLIVEIRCKRIDDHEINDRKAAAGLAAKTITKNEHRKLLDMPVTEEDWGEDIAGDPSPYEKEQVQKQEQQAQGMAGMAGGGAPGQGQPGQGQPGGEPQPGQEGQPGEEEGVPSLAQMLGMQGEEVNAELEEQRPGTGTLDVGALGPKMKTIRLGNKRLEPSYIKRLNKLKARDEPVRILEMLRKGLANGVH